MEVVLGLVSLVLLLFWLLTPSSRLRKLGNAIPGPRPAPLVGNALNFQVAGSKTFDELRNGRKQYGPTFRIWLGPQLHVFLSHPDDIQMMFSSQSMITKATVYDQLHSWLGNGLLVSTGEFWQRRRKAITPTFHFKVLDDFVAVFNKCGETLVSCLEEKAGTGVFDISTYISNCALDTVSESAMGIQVEAQTKPNSAYVKSVSKMTELLGAKINYPWLAVEPIYTISGTKSEERNRLKILHDLPRKVLIEKKNNLQSMQENDEDEMGIKKRVAFLERLLKIQKENSVTFQTDQDLLDEVTTFMFEGHDTTTSALSFTVWLLGKHQDVQENVYAEVSSHMANKPKLKIEDMQEMKYLERVIKESLRMYPPVPVIGRRLQEDTTFPSGYTLPAGCDAYASICLVHRDPEYFPEPDKFNPDRFLSEHQSHPFAYVPFSAGFRNCIGQKFAMLDLKAILAQLVYNYKISTEHEVILDQQLILRPLNGVHVTLTKRNVSS